MRTSRVRRIRTSQPKGNGRRSGRPYAAARVTAETAWLAVAIPAWNMRSLEVRGNVAPPRALGGAFAIHAPFEADEITGGS